MSFSAVAYKIPPRPTCPMALYPGIVQSIIEGIEYTSDKGG